MVQENPAPGAIVGRTIGFLLGDQFARLKVGDRFFFDLQNQAGSFTIGICTLFLSLTAGPSKRQALLEMAPTLFPNFFPLNHLYEDK